MSNEAVIKTSAVTREIVESFLFSSGTKLSEAQKVMFLNLSLQFNLNPFKREIYAVPFGSGFNFVVGYAVYISRAEATGKLDGWEVEAVREDGKLTGAKITIHRKDWAKPFQWEVSLEEFNRHIGNWKTMPEFMIKKVCIAQGFRLCFPNEFSGMPYIAEELTGDSVKDVTSAEEIPQPEAIEPQTPDFHFFASALNEAGDIETLRASWERLRPQMKLLTLSERMKLQELKNKLKAELQAGVEL